MKMKSKWTRRSYDAVFDWINPEKTKRAEEILLADGLTDVVTTLRAADNMGVWYRLTREAAAQVGPQIVRAAAMAAR